MTLSYTRVTAEGNITNVPNKITCPNCYQIAYMDSDVELSENRRFYRNLQGRRVYEENYKCFYKCNNCKSQINAVVDLRE
ncbi:MAG: hypothetical protein ACR2F1_07885 [Nitrososphaeraceae archaeon]